MGYRVPAASARFEQEIKKSRFVGVASRAGTPEEAASTLAELRMEFRDATHYCWAYLLGDPGSSPRLRIDDDGEPSGTAGKPILNVLRHKNVGDVILVVIRFFGGVKLGAGGLVRAYSSTASGVMDRLQSIESTPLVPARLRVDFVDEGDIRHLLDDLGIGIDSVAYGASVELRVRIPTEEVGEVRRRITDRTRGRATIELADE
jgi:uncharacterized YigZ family protein